MITEKEIITCKELIDAVDDILWEKLCGPNNARIVCEEHPYMVNVFNKVVDAHNNMLPIYCDNGVNDEKYSGEIRSKIKEFIKELL